MKQDEKLIIYNIPFVFDLNSVMRYKGYEHRDGNGAYQTGFMISQGTIRRGSRCSTAKAFLRPVRKRKNLHIAMHSHVMQILIDPITYQAYGVKFERKGKIYIIRANKEVILSAGAVNSPQILMLSGVGPKEHLSQLGIPVISDLRVGDNLQVRNWHLKSTRYK